MLNYNVTCLGKKPTWLAVPKTKKMAAPTVVSPGSLGPDVDESVVVLLVGSAVPEFIQPIRVEVHRSGVRVIVRKQPAQTDRRTAICCIDNETGQM